jgi:two-component system sensor histidine kinase CpxA
MHRLFWKLFVTYWVALILFTVGSLFTASYYLEQTRAQRDAANPMQAYAARLDEARAAAAANGKAGLLEWVAKTDAEELVPLLVLDRDGRDLTQREVSSRAFNHLRRHLRRNEAMTPDSDRRRNIVLPDGTEYWLVPDFQGANLGRFLTRPKVIAVPLALAALVSGLVCLLLARYLAAPMERLRRATQSYAAGDFTQRVSPSMGKRRDEIVDLAHALDHMAERLDALLGSQRALLRDVSHELRSPLARIQAALGLARQHGSGAERELDRIEHQTERLNELIGEILTFSRLDTGVHKVAFEPLDLAELLAELVDSARLEGTARGIQIDYAETNPAPCMGDPMLLHSVLDNVLRNAILHSPDAGRIEVSLSDETDAAGQLEHVVRIRDQGAGVPAEMLESIFEPFVRVDAARDRNRGGVGLGLPIARRAIQAHHGEIRAENHPLGGLQVSIRLPRGEA